MVSYRWRWAAGSAVLGILGMLSACSVAPVHGPAPVGSIAHPSAPGPLTERADRAPAAAGAAGAALSDAQWADWLARADAGPLPAPLVQPRSRWVPARWADLPGLRGDALHEAWNAWLRSCERPTPAFAAICVEVRQLSIGSGEQQLAWMLQRLQPYRIEPLQGSTEGLLTAYFEPIYAASRTRQPGFEAPLYAPPPGLAQRRPWFTRQEIDTLPEAQTALAGRVIAWLADPVDVLILQIQGSGRLQVTEPDGRVRTVRVAFAATNDQPYRSVGRWLLDQGAVRDASWPGIRAWMAANPQRVQEMLWSNPRVVFFREEPLDALAAGFGPIGAQGVALTPGRSVAVDRDSVPYGTPLWLSSSGPQAVLQRLVLAQDTGSAIVGPVRGDYFVGWGAEAGDWAGRFRQPLQWWALWPRSAVP